MHDQALCSSSMIMMTFIIVPNYMIIGDILLSLNIILQKYGLVFSAECIFECANGIVTTHKLLWALV
jgi:hypothetical protein